MTKASVVLVVNGLIIPDVIINLMIVPEARVLVIPFDISIYLVVLSYVIVAVDKRDYTTLRVNELDDTENCDGSCIYIYEPALRGFAVPKLKEY